MRRLLLAGALLAFPAAAAAQNRQAELLREVGFDQRLGSSLPLDLSFRDEGGRAVRLREYFRGKPVVLTLVYYECPMLCTLTLNGLVSALRVLSFDVGREFEVVTVSFDPRETAAQAATKKKVYLERYGRPEAADGWHFLTGDKEALSALTEAVGFRFAWDEATRQFAHPAGILVATPEGTIARYLFGIEYAPKDLRLALVESAQGRIGSVLDQVALYCYRYDPQTGRYGAVVMRILRASAILTVAALAAFIGTMWRRERRGGRPPGGETVP